MTQQKKTKTFVRGSYLYLDKQSGYQQQENMLQAKQKVVQDKIGILKYHQQLKQKAVQVNNKRKDHQGNKIVQKPVLIPIRDTPVQPVPQPVLENQKCQRAMQQQFDYFQSYISQKQKQKKFEQQEQERISQFLSRQRKLKQRQIESTPNETNIIVMQKEQEQKQPSKTKKIIKIKIKKKNEVDS